MAKKECIKRLKREMKDFTENPPPYIPAVAVNERNICEWHYLLQGPPDTPYHGGWYVGKLKYPADYPYKPPAIMMLTPNGRFKTGTRLCLSMSDFHPESWNPMWSVSTVLTGLLSFMCESTPTTGAITPATSEEATRELARASLAHNLRNAAFREMFPQLEEAAAAAGVDPAQIQAVAVAEPDEAPEEGEEEEEGGGGGGGEKDEGRRALPEEPTPAVLVEDAAAAAAAAAEAGASHRAHQDPREAAGTEGQGAGPSTAAAAVAAASTSGQAAPGAGLEEAVALLDQGDPEAALQRIQELLAAHSDATAPHSVVPLALVKAHARAQVALGELELAAAALAEAAAAGPGGGGGEEDCGALAAAYRAAALAKDKGDKAFRRRKYAAAAESYAEALAGAADCAPLQSNAAAALLAAGGPANAEAALAACERALAVHRGHLKAKLRRADCLVALGGADRAAAAATAYGELAALYPDDADLCKKLEHAASLCAA